MQHNSIKAVVSAVSITLGLGLLAVIQRTGQGPKFAEPTLGQVAETVPEYAPPAPPSVETVPGMLVVGQAQKTHRQAARFGAASCRVHVLEQGGSPEHPTVKVCEGSF